MNKKGTILLIITILLSVLIAGVVISVGNILKEKTECELVVIKLQQPDFFLKESPDVNSLYKCMQYYDICHKDIVMAQAILETGNFKSRVCKEYNNLFGLYNSRRGSYFRFNHWSESVLAYKEFIQYRYKEGEDYYRFLRRINYAEDTTYVRKLKSIINKNGKVR